VDIWHLMGFVFEFDWIRTCKNVVKMMNRSVRNMGIMNTVKVLSCLVSFLKKKNPLTLYSLYASKIVNNNCLYIVKT